MRFSMEWKVGLGLTILLSLIDPNNSPGWRIAVLVAGCVLFLDAARGSNWIKGHTETLSLTKGVTSQEAPSAVRLISVQSLIAVMVAVLAIVTWPVRKPIASIQSPMLTVSLAPSVGTVPTPNGTLPPNVVAPTPPSKPLPSKPKPKPQAKLELQPQPIQIAPSFGNIRERAHSLSQEIMEDLYQHGWPQRAGQQMPSIFVMQQMPTTEPELGQWVQGRSRYFRARFFEKVLDMGNEFSQLHYRDPELEDFFKYEGMMEDADKQIAMVQPGRNSTPILPQMIEEVAERLKVLGEDNSQEKLRTGLWTNH